MTIFLDVLLVLAAICVAATQWASLGASGPESKIPLALMAVPPLVLVAVALAVAMVRGSFSWIPGGFLLECGAWIGILASMWTLMAVSADRDSGVWRLPAAVSVYLLLAVCVVAIHGFAWMPSGSLLRIPVAAFLGLMATGGWATGAAAVWGITVKGPEENRRAVQQIKLSEARYEFDHIEENAPIWRYLNFIDSEEPSVSRRARNRVTDWPNRDQVLIPEMGSWFFEVASYIANVHPNPKAKLGDPFGVRLGQYLEEWKPFFLPPLREQPKKGLEDFIRAAERFERAGVDLDAPLQAWHDFLKSDPRLEPYAQRIEAILGSSHRAMAAAK
ncbi:MAG: hypothetical protein ABI823_07200 [Bryobacteraceae bacterium]